MSLPGSSILGCARASASGVLLNCLCPSPSISLSIIINLLHFELETATVYQASPSDNAYKVRLMLGLLGIPCEDVDVNLAAGEQKQAAFLRLNPMGQECRCWSTVR